MYMRCNCGWEEGVDLDGGQRGRMDARDTTVVVVVAGATSRSRVRLNGKRDEEARVSETHDGWVVRTRYASSAPMANSAAKYWMIVMTTIRVRCEVARA